VRLLGLLLQSDVTEQRIHDYMAKRIAENAGGRTINLDLQILACALRSTWKALWPHVKKFEENHDVGRALEPAEEKSIIHAAIQSGSMRDGSPLIHPFLFTLAWTGMRSDEARTLRWSQVDMGESGEITVGLSKTAAGKGRPKLVVFPARPPSPEVNHAS
jgi:hypothetical protein